MFSRLRLSTQLWLFLLLLIAASATGLTWYFGQVRVSALSAATSQQLKMKEESLAAKAGLLARNGALGSATAAVMMDFDFLQQVVATTVKGDPNIVFGYIADAQNKIVVHSDASKVGKTLEGVPSLPGGKVALSTTRVGDLEVLEAVATILVGQEPWGAVHYGVSLAPLRKDAAKARADLRAAIRSGVWISGGIAASLLVLAVLVAVVLARRLVRPVRSVEDAIQTALSGKTVRVEVPNVPELASVATGFNALVARLRQREQQLRNELRRSQMIAEGLAPAPQQRGAPASQTSPEEEEAAQAPPATGMSLRAQITTMMLGITALSVLTLSGVFFFRLRGELHRSLSQMSEQIRADQAEKGVAITRNAALAAGQAAEGKDFLFLINLVKSTLGDDVDIVDGFVADSRGKVLIHQDPSKTGTVNNVAEHEQAMKQARPESRQVVQDGTGMLEVTAPIQVDGSSWGTISFGLSRGRLEKAIAEVERVQAQRVDEAFLAGSVGVGALMIIALLAAWLASRRIAGPLRKLTTDLKKIRDGNLDVRVRIRACREFATFAMGINELTATTRERDEEIKRQIARAETRARRQALLTSLAQAGASAQFEDLDVASLIDEVRDSLATPARDKQLRMSIPALNGSIRIAADRRLLGQLLYELVANAIQFTQTAGSVAVELDLAASRQRLRIWVRDSGVGLDPQEIDRLLVPPDPGTPRVQTTATLGLALVRRIAELHGAYVRAESQGRGKGCSFVIDLPVEQKREQAA